LSGITLNAPLSSRISSSRTGRERSASPHQPHTSLVQKSVAMSTSADYVHMEMDRLRVQLYRTIVVLTRRRGKFGIGPRGRTTEAADEGLACHLLGELHGVLVLN
jgi:hypothetical protein